MVIHLLNDPETKINKSDQVEISTTDTEDSHKNYNNEKGRHRQGDSWKWKHRRRDINGVDRHGQAHIDRHT